MAAGLRGVRNGVTSLRKGWHDEAVKVHGEPLPWHVLGAISRAADAERVRQLGQRLAASCWGDDPARAVDLEQQAQRAGEQRDACLRLALTPGDTDPGDDPLAAVLRSQRPSEAVGADQGLGYHRGGSDSPEKHTGNSTGHPEGRPI